MPAFAKARTVAIARRPAGVSKSRFEALKERSKSAGRRLKELASEDTDALTAVATGVGLAMLEERGTKLPTIGGYNPKLVWGFGLYALTRKSKSKTSGMVRSAAIAMATIGANEATKAGSLKVAGVDDDEDDE